MNEDASLIITEQNINILNLSYADGRDSCAVVGDGGREGRREWVGEFPHCA